MKRVIYETRGRAREFNELAINLFTGCGHQCIYCYGADVTHQTKDKFNFCPKPRVTVEEIRHSAHKLAQTGETRRVLLCFVTDPYQPVEAETQLTRKAILALHAEGFGVHILTKAGERSTRDFDLLTSKDAYATTLTLVRPSISKEWEPNAALPGERVAALRAAHEQGIETWVSLEQVISPAAVHQLLAMTKDFVGHYKVGTMNYHPHGNAIDWYAFGWGMKKMMDRAGVRYYFKRDLLKEMGVNPREFQQTWECR